MIEIRETLKALSLSGNETIAIQMLIDGKSKPERSEEQGKAKYRAYFVRTSIYAKWKPDVDTILITDGYEDIIVTVLIRRIQT